VKGVEHPDLSQFLSRLAKHTRLDDAEQRAILDLPTQVIEVDAKRDLVGLGQNVDHVHVVVKGVLARYGQNAEGDRQIIALHIAGDAPDLHTVVLPGDTVPLEALTSATVLRVAHADLRMLAARYPAVAEAFWRHCSIDAAITAVWVVNLGRRDARTRIAHLLCEMAMRQVDGVPGKQVNFPFPITQTQLADATGLTPVHVNRSLKALEAAGYVKMSRFTARVSDWPGLVAQAQFDPRYIQSDFKAGERLRIVA